MLEGIFKNNTYNKNYSNEICEASEEIGMHPESLQRMVDFFDKRYNFKAPKPKSESIEVQALKEKLKEVIDNMTDLSAVKINKPKI